MIVDNVLKLEFLSSVNIIIQFSYLQKNEINVLFYLLCLWIPQLSYYMGKKVGHNKQLRSLSLFFYNLKNHVT